jgi:hypothetical protein
MLLMLVFILANVVFGYISAISIASLKDKGAIYSSYFSTHGIEGGSRQFYIKLMEGDVLILDGWLVTPKFIDAIMFEGV